jgi:hypothetical protein
MHWPRRTVAQQAALKAPQFLLLRQCEYLAFAASLLFRGDKAVVHKQRRRVKLSDVLLLSCGRSDELYNEKGAPFSRDALP